MPMVARSRNPTFAELFTPKLVTIIREGYGPAGLKADAVAGLTVAILALVHGHRRGLRPYPR